MLKRKFKSIVSEYRLTILSISIILLFGCESERTKLSTAAENVHLLSTPLTMPGLERARNIRIYLPPNYQTTKQSYPVLYMHDGQNLFDDVTSYVGEWGVDETLNKLHKEKGFSLIVVGIDNGQERRMNELSPWQNKQYGPAEGEQYVNFIVKVVKPYIDQHYRTLTAKQHTGIMGSSMGGLISHYAILKYPNTFSKAGIFSPSFWYSDQVYQFTQENGPLKSAQLFYLMGGKEGADSIVNMTKMIDQLKQQGHPSNNIYSDVVEGGEHNEGFWREHFPRAVLWLFEK